MEPTPTWQRGTGREIQRCPNQLARRDAGISPGSSSRTTPMCRLYDAHRITGGKGGGTERGGLLGGGKKGGIEMERVEHNDNEEEKRGLIEKD